MKFKMPDERILEISYGTDRPPGYVGQQTNVNRPWYRFDGEDWQQSEERSLPRVLQTFGLSMKDYQYPEDCSFGLVV